MTKRLPSQLTVNLGMNDGMRKRCCRIDSVERIASFLPHSPTRTKHKIMSPQETLVSIYGHHYYDVRVVSSLEINSSFFAEEMEDDDMLRRQTAMDAIRAGDVEALRALLRQGYSLRGTNRFGESLIHFACRVGNHRVVSFLVDEAELTLLCRDEYGRTPLHEACWASEPNFEMLYILIRNAPELLLLSDKRGYAPLEYVRENDWKVWNEFIQRNETLFLPMNGGKLQILLKECAEDQVRDLEDEMDLLSTT